MKFWPQKDAPFFKLKALFALGCYGFISGVFLVIAILYYYSTQVPDYRTLAEYKPKLITKVYDRNGEILVEYAKQRRLYVPIDEMPKMAINAYLAAEDDQFYHHIGFDLIGIARAAVNNILGRSRQGASTITQQVAKNFLLTNERTYTRKIKELILSYRIEQAFSKDKILELYLNEIYLGSGSYGVAAAAHTYYGKELDELTNAQFAMLAGLPKAPSRYSPISNPQVARYRRDVVLGRMAAEGFISEEERLEAVAEDLNVERVYLADGEAAPHFSEHVRRFVLDMYGEEALYTGGYNIHTTLDKELQSYAEEAVYKNLREYDRRHGYRGPIDRMGLLINWQGRIDNEVDDWKHRKQIGTPAVVLEVNDAEGIAQIGLPKNTTGFIELKTLEWARAYEDEDNLGPRIKKVSDVLAVNDVILVKPMAEVYNPVKGAKLEEGYYSLEQIPQVQGAFLALEAETGAILAMVGGLDDGTGGTGLNRAVQAKRQVGSSLKPLVYAMALEKGYTPASLILDAPVVLRNDEMDKTWKPQNYSEKVYGESTLRRGLEKSRNLMTIRLARQLGIGNIIRYIRKFGITADMERNLSTALGSSSISLMEMTGAYSVFTNGGRLVHPYAVNYIQDPVGNVIYREHDACESCRLDIAENIYKPEPLPKLGEQVIPETTAFQMAELLKGIVRNGSAWRAKAVGQAVGAKTGTTNDFIDAWLMGISPNMALGSWVGFDRPTSMGNAETGSAAAAPIWVDFAVKALNKDGQQPLYFKVPNGISFVQIDADTGLLPNSKTKRKIFEAFEHGTEPTSDSKASQKVLQAEGQDIQWQGIY
ncbi:MAG: penicillin-binding protein [Magnetococcales bacterium]|nr:penicillin-binding protein [Magnetococcales bacterium]